MRAVVVDRDRESGVRLRADYPKPTPAAGEVLVRVRLAGVCSTDLELTRGYMAYDGVLGHEFVGTVASDVVELRGRRVVAEINCAPRGVGGSEAARKHVMPRTVLGILGRDGAFAEYVTVPAENCHVVPASVEDEAAVFAEPVAAALQVLEDHPGAARGETAVLGSGRLGILCGLVLKAEGGDPLMIGRNVDSLGTCANLGLRTSPVGELACEPRFDTVVECTGNAEGLKLALAVTRPRGTLVLKSTYAEAPTVDLAPVVINELRVLGNRCGPIGRAVSLLARRAFDVGALIAARYPLDEAERAFAEAARPGMLKVLLECGADGI